MPNNDRLELNITVPNHLNPTYTIAITQTTGNDSNFSSVKDMQACYKT
jgi:glycine betaine/choline ABC-type transport system substrate-binding protein